MQEHPKTGKDAQNQAKTDKDNLYDQRHAKTHKRQVKTCIDPSKSI